MARLKSENYKGVKIHFNRRYVATNKGVKPYIVGKYYKDNKPVKYRGHSKKQVLAFVKKQLKVSLKKKR